MTEQTWRSSCPNQATCVEVGDTGGGIVVRSNRRPLEVITADYDEWDAFIAAVKHGDFDWTVDTLEEARDAG